MEVPDFFETPLDLGTEGDSEVGVDLVQVADLGVVGRWNSFSNSLPELSSSIARHLACAYCR
ncbi:hypothetical protein ACFYST_01915 [Kitasatospora sp. NPDC004614]|uniref:hypothetical protein n=1 Tax=unclassified Kitasatospora TaxID=2633591 RepID=UPI0036800B7A